MSLLLLGAGRSFAAEAPAPAAKPGAPAAAKAAPAKVEKSSAPAAALEPQTIAEVYNGLSVRDPFISVLGGGAAAPATDSGEPVKPNIHNMQLRGILSGAKTKFAMLEDASAGTRFVLKEDGKLYDARGKAVDGITGSIKSSSMTVLTTSADGDVQTLKLGEQKQ